MARGWESKSVEEQMNERQAAKEPASDPPSTQEEREQRVKRESLLLARTHTLNALKAARDERYREQLKRALEHLDSQLADL